MSLNIESSTGTLINITGKKLQSQLAAELSQHGIAIGQVPFLRQLYLEDNLQQNQLSQRVGLEPSTTVRTLDRMEKNGLIQRKNSQEDRRVYKISLTEKAKSIKNIILRSTKKVNSKATKGFTNKEVDLLHQLLLRINDNMK